MSVFIDSRPFILNYATCPIRRLSGGVAIIQVGAATETEIKEKKHRIEDALAATKATVEEGIVFGRNMRMSLPNENLTTFQPLSPLREKEQESIEKALLLTGNNVIAAYNLEILGASSPLVSYNIYIS